MGWAKVDLPENKQGYWFTKRYCFRCKKITQFMRCDNCSHFFCTEHAETADIEYAEYGSILDPGGYPIHNC